MAVQNRQDRAILSRSTQEVTCYSLVSVHHKVTPHCNPGRIMLTHITMASYSHDVTFNQSLAPDPITFRLYRSNQILYL